MFETFSTKVFTILGVYIVGNILRYYVNNGKMSTIENEDISLENVNKREFMDRVLFSNYTYDFIDGERVKYFVTNNGDWHIDSCSIIGKEGYGVIVPKIMNVNNQTDIHDHHDHRRLNPMESNNLMGLWKNGIIPYIFDHPYIKFKSIQDLWNRAIQHFHDNTPLRFYEWKNKDMLPQYYVRVYKGNGCNAILGRVSEEYSKTRGYKGNELSLDNGCWVLETIIHELGHVAGFGHTHQRKDRDKYVFVNYNIIPKDWHDNYKKINMPICGNYDCSSVMHYQSELFFRNGQFSMYPIKDSGCKRIQRNPFNPLSITDKFCLCILYKPGINGAKEAFDVCKRHGVVGYIGTNYVGIRDIVRIIRHN